MPKVELFGMASCPFTNEMRAWLDWNKRDYVEYDVESDSEARARMLAITGGERTVPVLVEGGKATQIGWRGRGCLLNVG